jgi:hypothetical protein
VSGFLIHISVAFTASIVYEVAETFSILTELGTILKLSSLTLSAFTGMAFFLRFDSGEMEGSCARAVCTNRIKITKRYFPGCFNSLTISNA